jgi:hypothetical protein
MMFALLSGTDIQRQPVPHHLITLKTKERSKKMTCNKKMLDVCQRRVLKIIAH